MQTKLRGIPLVLVVCASVAASSESQIDSVDGANDVSFLQASLDFNMPAETLKEHPIILTEEAVLVEGNKSGDAGSLDAFQPWGTSSVQCELNGALLTEHRSCRGLRERECSRHYYKVNDGRGVQCYWNRRGEGANRCTYDVNRRVCSMRTPENCEFRESEWSECSPCGGRGTQSRSVRKVRDARNGGTCVTPPTQRRCEAGPCPCANAGFVSEHRDCSGLSRRQCSQHYKVLSDLDNRGEGPNGGGDRPMAVGCSWNTRRGTCTYNNDRHVERCSAPWKQTRMRAVNGCPNGCSPQLGRRGDLCAPAQSQRYIECEGCDFCQQPAANCQWMEFPWNECSVDCGPGVQTRRAPIKTSEARYGGTCVQPTQEQACNLGACPAPVNCVWQYGDWSPCTKTCGLGTQSRRAYKAQTEAHGGTCGPHGAIEQSCSPQDCPCVPSPACGTEGMCGGAADGCGGTCDNACPNHGCDDVEDGLCLCDDTCTPSMVHLESDDGLKVVMLESAASHKTTFPGKVYVPAYMSNSRGRIFEIDVTTNPPTSTIAVDEIQRIHTSVSPSYGQNDAFRPFGTRLASDGRFFVLDYPVANDGWLIIVDLHTRTTQAQFRVCQPNDLDIHEENDGADITAYVGQAYRSSSDLASNYKCEQNQMVGGAYGNIIEIKVKANGVYKCSPGVDPDDDWQKCSWDNFDQYAQNTRASAATARWTTGIDRADNPHGTPNWRVLGRSNWCCNALGCWCTTGPIVGVSYHHRNKEIWTMHLTSMVRTDMNPGKDTYGISSREIYARNWYGEFESEYSSPYKYGALDNTKWLDDYESNNPTLIAAIYEVFMAQWASVGLVEQYGDEGYASYGMVADRAAEGRKWRTGFKHVVAMAFCTSQWDGWMVGDSDAALDGVASKNKIFRYNPTADNRVDTGGGRTRGALKDPDENFKFCNTFNCDLFDPDAENKGLVEQPLSILADFLTGRIDTCFTGRVTHLEPVLSHDTFVGINYQSRGVLVLKDAGLKRLECNTWAPVST